MYSIFDLRHLIISSLIPIFLLTASCHREKVSPDPSSETIIFEFQEDKFKVENGGGYAGPSRCRECHPGEYDSWQKTRHARSYKTLTNIGRSDDIDCLRCHTTGFSRRTGFRNIDETADLASVGCEVCHGASLDHIESVVEGEAGSIFGIRKDCKRCEYIKYCIRCHNFANDPDFDLSKDLKAISH